MPVPSSLREAVAGSALAVAYDFNRDREDDLAAQAAYFPLFDYEGADDQPHRSFPIDRVKKGSSSPTAGLAVAAGASAAVAAARAVRTWD
ncbi:unnamed protein product [Tilletia controversa]|uniref:Uncharacterized protein n=1 Tax=Tilletia controversa TaxID=13291 RepID=A0A8X7SRK9_9BASI|nr:hypothetical protein A4X06_0g9815 [Tilletia controversa]CAD6931557.1 unnamed protein product [Tilletia controversa]